MAFPYEIIEFLPRYNITVDDGAKIKEYQQLIQAGNWDEANAVLQSISQWGRKIINASYLNSIASTCNALEKYYLERYSPAYIVSATQPVHQDNGDFWFQITGEST